MATENPTIDDLQRNIKWLKRRVKRQRLVGYMNGVLDGALKMVGPGDVLIDCGANLGEITKKMAATGAQVYAFEPDPWTFEKLRNTTREMENVTCIQAAVGAEAGQFQLYRTADFHDKPRRASIASSIVPQMRDVDTEGESITVDVVCFPDWVEELIDEGKQVRLLKVDIEGAEIGLMNALMDRDLPYHIDLTLVETHEKQMPSAAEDFAQMRKRAEDFPAGRINFDWI